MQQRTSSVNRLALHRPDWRLVVVCLTYLFLSGLFASMKLDIDEFGFIREPYEMLGGDYTQKYLQEGKFAEAAHTAARSYWFYWNYRPLFSPIIRPEDRDLFAREEARFGYRNPGRVRADDPAPLVAYESRLIVPEPDRFYTHGAGKPLLSQVISIPQLALTRMFTPAPKTLLYYQFHYDYHPIFILTRIAQILAGLATVLLVYWILLGETDQKTALIGCAIVAFFPTCVRFFPNIHHDAVMAPFVIGAMGAYHKGWRKTAGLLFGCALATKNVSILLIPAFVAYSIVAAARRRHSASANFAITEVYVEAKGLVTVALVAICVLIPFANPISYAQEIATPITQRAFDVRGEDVDSFSLSAQLGGSVEDSSATPVQMQWTFIRNVLRLHDTAFFFLAISVLLFLSQRRSPLSWMSLVFLLCTLPLGLIFGNALNYRALMFIAPFAVLCALLAPRRYLLALACVLLIATVMSTVDPVSEGGLHIRVGTGTLWQALIAPAPG